MHLNIVGLNPPLKNIFLIGFNHETASLSLRERLAFDSDQLLKSYIDLKDNVGLHEALILSTCNRTEIYVFGENCEQLLDWISARKGIPIDNLNSHVYTRSGIDVVIHAASVASGMDSMVLGETQIFGQMKVAYRQSDASNCLGRISLRVLNSSNSANALGFR